MGATITRLMQFSHPLWLLFLLLIPASILIGMPGSGRSWKKAILSHILRTWILICLVSALAGIELVRAVDELAVVFLVDLSDSMSPDARSQALTYISDALSTMGPDDQAGVVVFGQGALVEKPMSRDRSLDRFTSIPLTSQTDLGQAIDLGSGMLPSDTARRMVILSDGIETLGSASRAARVARAAGIQLLSLPVVPASGAEVLISDLQVPHRLLPGETFDLQLTLEASQSGPALVRIFQDAELAYEAEVTLSQGLNTYRIPFEAGSPGFIRLRAQVSSRQDGLPQNNELAGFSLVIGPPRLLMVAPATGERYGSGAELRPDETSALRGALEASGYSIAQVLPQELPPAVAELAGYAAIQLVDVPASRLSSRQMEALQTYVRDTGGGLLVVGGLTSYGVGGYFQTPLETTLPLEMQIKDDLRRPRLTLVFIIDRSGSMSETSGGVSKLSLAQEAAVRSIELLFPSDRVGVVAFDEQAQWVAPITGLEQAEAIIQRIGSLRPGGGTDILAGLQAMANALPQDPAEIKHVILLTDGGADPAGIPELIIQLNDQAGITLSTVAVGRDAAPYLADLASLGGGRFHFAADPGTIPTIFTTETTLATRAYLIEREFIPRQIIASPILTGLPDFPPLYGYVATSPKPAGQVVLVSDLLDPVLATWQYGLGRATAFTSDASGRWAQAWVQWEGYPTFWGQVVREIAQVEESSAFSLTVSPDEENARLEVEARDDQGGFLNHYQIEATVVDPDGASQLVHLEQTAPGRYEGVFEPRSEGAYLIHLIGTSPDPARTQLAETQGWVRSYSPEYRLKAETSDSATRLLQITGGELAPRDPREVFAHTLPSQRATRPIWPWLLVAAAALLPMDIAVRRLQINWQEAKNWPLRLATRLRTQPPPASLSPVREDRMDALLKAKQRASHPPGSEGPDTLQASSPPTPAHIRSPVEGHEAIQNQVNLSAREDEDTIPEESTTTAAALLAKKRAREGKQ